MAIVVEDGTGLSNAVSLCSVADADTYWAARNGADWSGASAPLKEVALVKASDYIRNQKRYRWTGGKKTYAQKMPWPRTNAGERDGTVVPDNVVPWQVTEATAFLANRFIQDEELDLQPDLARGGQVKSETVGPISTTYMDGAPMETVILAVDGILSPLLRDPRLDPVPPADFQEAAPDSLTAGRFEYP